MSGHHTIRILKNVSAPLLGVVDEFSRKIFMNLPVVNHRTGYKYLKQQRIGPLYASYYEADNTRPFRDVLNDFQTTHEMRRKEALEQRKKIGKGPPKKGQGKRQKKK